MRFPTKRVDYADPHDSADLVRLMCEYARLETGESDPDLGRLVGQLADFPTSFSVLAYDEPEQRTAIGLVNCFFGFSTFTGRRLVNLHDVIVTEKHRGKGVSSAMLRVVEQIAIEHDCCRLTLEVYAENAPAMRAYQKQGFMRDPAHPDTDTLFLRKPLPA
jgi:GNAT superfamily N-acetyltransferase